ncbi:MAG: Hsp20/alpha crystallin family protein [Acidobacteriota bacterium]
MVKIKKGLLGELDELHQRMERVMEQVLGGRARAQPDWCPAADLYETETELVVILEVAGISPDSLDVTLEDQMLRVSGRRPEVPPRPSCVALHQMEIEYGPFERLFAVPPHLDGEAGTARLENGFLEIRIPKSAPHTTASCHVEIESE